MDNQAETMTAWYYLPYTFSVTIDAPDASATYYTLDGTTPTEDSARYTEGAVLAFSGVGEVLIRAVNVYADGVVSDVTTRGFALDDAERIAAKIAEEQILRARCAEILDEITRDELSDYDKILAAHDWVVLSAEYEYEREAFLHGDNPDYVQEYTPQEAFVRLPPRSSVFICEDYAYLLQFLLHEIGIACYAVHGDAADGQAHVWNLVKLGGDWYHVDPTWDEGGGNTVRHGYFLRSDETMRASRTWAFADFPTAVADYDKRTK
jgi:transglutaminase/protease-like cytokinesis protein 3